MSKGHGKGLLLSLHTVTVHVRAGRTKGVIITRQMTWRAASTRFHGAGLQRRQNFQVFNQHFCTNKSMTQRQNVYKKS